LDARALLKRAAIVGSVSPPETVTITGDGTVSATGTWDSTQGTSWDNDAFDVSSVLPAGQTTLAVEISSGNDCIALSAAVLVVAQ
jgi:hypothetical protein